MDVDSHVVLFQLVIVFVVSVTIFCQKGTIFWFLANTICTLLGLEHQTPYQSIADGIEPNRKIKYNQIIELYHNGISICSQQVRLCLEELKIKYKSNHIHIIETGFYQNLHAKYSNINPARVVPMLVHKGIPIHEAVDIIRYIQDNINQLPHNRETETLSLSVNKDKYPTLYDDMNAMIDCTKLDAFHINFEKSMGSCILYISLSTFLSMIVDKNISYWSILYGLIFHFDMKRPITFLGLKMFGKHLFKLSPLNNERGKARYYARKHLKVLNDILNKNNKYGPYICGKYFTLADIAWIPVFERLYGSGSQDLLDLNNMQEFDKNTKNLLYEYWEAMKQRECYKKAIYEWKTDGNKCCIIDRSEKRLIEWINNDKEFCKNVRIICIP